MTDGPQMGAGDDKWREVMRFDPPPITDPYTEYTNEHVFGRLWARQGLARRDRRLVSLTAIAMHGLKEPLVAHLNAALASQDLTADELHEWVLAPRALRRLAGRRQRLRGAPRGARAPVVAALIASLAARRGACRGRPCR